jgi:hypothetical protein
MSAPIRRRDRDAMLNSLRAGVAPSCGFEHIQVGRAAEVEALGDDIRLVRDGGSAARFIVGGYGSGKTFFLQVMRHAAQRAGCLTMNANVSQNARIYGSAGKVRTLISGLVASTASRSQPNGGALGELLQKFVSICQDKAQDDGRDLMRVARDALSDLRGYTRGFEFVEVVLVYVRASRDGDPYILECCERWFRAEYRLKSEAKAAIGVNGIVGDTDLYPLLRLFAALSRRAGYRGLVVELDEMGVMDNYQKGVRDQSYEELLTMLNDLHTGRAEGLAMFFAGVPEFVRDPVRGLYSYPALRSRLATSEFVQPGMVDTAGPVIDLAPFSAEDLQILVENIHRVYVSNGQRDPLPADDLTPLSALLEHCADQLGGLKHLTAREASKRLIGFLDVQNLNPKLDWRTVLGRVQPELDEAPAASVEESFQALLASQPLALADDLADVVL